MNMDNFRLLFITAAILLLPHVGSSDIIVTTDDMILNGKIIEDIKNDHVKLGNYHGIFKINYAQIKKMHNTDNYQEDIKILKKMGKSVSETEIKSNFHAGIIKLEAKNLETKKLEAKKLEAKNLETKKLEAKKLEAKNISGKMIKARSIDHLLFVSPFFIINAGKMQSVLPLSVGVSLMGDIRIQSKNNYIPGWIRIDFQYFHSGSGINRISAPRFSLGAVWKIPLVISGFSFNLALAPSFGAGYYAIKGSYYENSSLKWNTTAAIGLEFFFSSWVFYPQIRLDYIHVGAAPLLGIGLYIGAGYLLNLKTSIESN